MQFIVNRIRRLLADESETIYDKKRGKVRRLRAGDIAILCPTNARLESFAEILRENGVRSLIEQDGWYESRIVQLMVNALHYVADPSDRHAVLSLCVTELGSHTLESALTSLIAGEMPAELLLDRLQPVKALVEISPDFDAQESADIFIDRLFPDMLDGAARLLYVALTRAREKLILEWPEYQSKSKSKSGSFWSLLSSKTGMSLSGTTMSVLGKPFECIVSTYPPCETSDEVDELPIIELESKLSNIGRRAIKPGTRPDTLIPEGVSPSSLHDENAVRVDGVETFQYGESLHIGLSVEGAERGTLLHRCFELMSENAIEADKLSRITGYQFCAAEVNDIFKAAASIG